MLVELLLNNGGVLFFLHSSSNAVFPLTIAHQLTALKFGQFIVLSINMDWSKLNPLWPHALYPNSSHS